MTSNNDMNQINTETIRQVVQEEVAPLVRDVSQLKVDVAGLKGDMVGLKGDFGKLKDDVSEIKKELTSQGVFMEEIRDHIKFNATSSPNPAII